MGNEVSTGSSGGDGGDERKRKYNGVNNNLYYNQYREVSKRQKAREKFNQTVQDTETQIGKVKKFLEQHRSVLKNAPYLHLTQFEQNFTKHQESFQKIRTIYGADNASTEGLQNISNALKESNDGFHCSLQIFNDYIYEQSEIEKTQLETKNAVKEAKRNYAFFNAKKENILQNISKKDKSRIEKSSYFQDLNGGLAKIEKAIKEIEEYEKKDQAITKDGLSWRSKRLEKSQEALLEKWDKLQKYVNSYLDLRKSINSAEEAITSAREYRDSQRDIMKGKEASEAVISFNNSLKEIDQQIFLAGWSLVEKEATPNELSQTSKKLTDANEALFAERKELEQFVYKEAHSRLERSVEAMELKFAEVQGYWQKHGAPSKRIEEGLGKDIPRYQKFLENAKAVLKPKEVSDDTLKKQTDTLQQLDTKIVGADRRLQNYLREFEFRQDLLAYQELTNDNIIINNGLTIYADNVDTNGYHKDIDTHGFNGEFRGNSQDLSEKLSKMKEINQKLLLEIAKLPEDQKLEVELYRVVTGDLREWQDKMNIRFQSLIGQHLERINDEISFIDKIIRGERELSGFSGTVRAKQRFQLLQQKGMREQQKTTLEAIQQDQEIDPIGKFQKILSREQQQIEKIKARYESSPDKAILEKQLADIQKDNDILKSIKYNIDYLEEMKKEGIALQKVKIEIQGEKQKLSLFKGTELMEKIQQIEPLLYIYTKGTKDLAKRAEQNILDIDNTVDKDIGEASIEEISYAEQKNLEQRVKMAGSEIALEIDKIIIEGINDDISGNMEFIQETYEKISNIYKERSKLQQELQNQGENDEKFKENLEKRQKISNEEKKLLEQTLQMSSDLEEKGRQVEWNLSAEKIRLNIVGDFLESVKSFVGDENSEWQIYYQAYEDQVGNYDENYNRYDKFFQYVSEIREKYAEYEQAHEEEKKKLDEIEKNSKALLKNKN